ncbi:MAG: hypothetical protein M0R32_03535 [Candidatus Cloacimonetes bacterium]|jgi:hypothetical protein|nr:hypothetical protein [Candidatus Cloacimonadota bacterium]
MEKWYQIYKTSQTRKGHKLFFSCLAWRDEDSEEALNIQFPGLVHINTRPGEKPWRMTIFDQVPNPMNTVHHDMSSEFEYRAWRGDDGSDWKQAIAEMIADNIDPFVFEVDSVETSPL